MGIPTDTLPHIFEPLYRADPSRSLMVPAPGLAVAKMIVEYYGGKLEVTSQIEAGSAFSLILKW